MGDPYKKAIRSVFPESTFIDEMESASELKSQAVTVEALFTRVVGLLRTHPNAALAKLGRALWDILHHRHVHLALSSVVDSVSFAVMGRDGQRAAMILVPPRWVDDLEQQMLMATGAVVCAGS